eukprot:TRINITY_DN657_c0_g1_i10.p1 TRINITY_DN657_c0_g1~~TRINITY_DN657_c0_g1_i10.p1  ORF type:complete len:123 (+),score=28.57 TRINITY_DN657_c0_g1_i10:454-822(+)
MRSEITGRLLLNLGIFSKMVATEQSPKVIRFCGLNHTEETTDVKICTFLGKFTGKEDSDAFLRALKTSIERASKEGTKESDEQTTTTTSTTTTTTTCDAEPTGETKTAKVHEGETREGETEV